MSMKNPMTPAGIEPATFRFVAQHLLLLLYTHILLLFASFLPYQHLPTHFSHYMPLSNSPGHIGLPSTQPNTFRPSPHQTTFSHVQLTLYREDRGSFFSHNYTLSHPLRQPEDYVTFFNGTVCVGVCGCVWV
jgi:hypothetical protein